jgi:hypothetical protein
VRCDGDSELDTVGVLKHLRGEPVSMATDKASGTREHRAEKHEPYVSWKADFFVIFALTVSVAGVLTSVLVL